MKPLDPVTLAVINGRLVQIADEMDATLYRSAFNPIIAEAHDACHGLYHATTGATYETWKKWFNASAALFVDGKKSLL